MDLCLGAACELNGWSECLEKMQAAIQTPKTALRSSSLAPRQCVVALPLSMNNPRWAGYVFTDRNAKL